MSFRYGRMDVSSEQVAGLGDELGNIADYLEVRAHGTRDGSQETYGFISPAGWGAFDDVLGDFELARIAACKELRRLRDLARAAGGCYVRAEDLVDSRHRGIM